MPCRSPDPPVGLRFRLEADCLVDLAEVEELLEALPGLEAGRVQVHVQPNLPEQLPVAWEGCNHTGGSRAWTHRWGGAACGKSRRCGHSSPMSRLPKAQKFLLTWIHEVQLQGGRLTGSSTGKAGKDWKPYSEANLVLG